MVDIESKLFEAIRGPLAGQFSFKTYGDKRGMVLEDKPELPYTRSEAQGLVRTNFSNAVDEWNGMTEEEKTDYQELAYDNNLTLFQAFMMTRLGPVEVSSDKELILTGQGIEEGLLPQPGEIVRYYCFDEGSGASLTDYALDQDGTITNPIWVEGYAGHGGLGFDGSSTYVEIPVLDIPDISLMTVIEWDVVPSDDQEIINSRDTGSNDDEILFDHNNGVEMRWRTDEFGFEATYSWTPETGVYYLWTGRNSDTDGDLFLGQTKVADGSRSSGSVTPDSTRIGRHAEGTNYHNGELSLLIIWQSKLTDAEIQDLAEVLDLT